MSSLIVAGDFLLRPSNNGRTATVATTFAYLSAIVGRITIPEGFVTDYNSTPRIIWRIFPPWEYPLAGVVHDELYQRGAADAGAIERWQADLVHHELMLALEAPVWKAKGAHLGLTVGGWKAWNKYRRNELRRAA